MKAQWKISLDWKQVCKKNKIVKGRFKKKKRTKLQGTFKVLTDLEGAFEPYRFECW